MSHFIPEPNFSEVTRLPAVVKKAYLKEKFKEIKNIINNEAFVMNDPDKGDPVTPCMYLYKAKIKSGGSLDNLKLIILVQGDLHNK